MARNHNLTERENEILELVAQGFCNKDIREKLVIADSTLRCHMVSIYSKLNLSNQCQKKEWSTMRVNAALFYLKKHQYKLKQEYDVLQQQYNAVVKQNKDLQKELQEVKKENEELKFYIDSYRQTWEVDKYHQALEEIRNNCTEMLETIKEEGKPNKSIRDTIWCKNIPCCTLYELIENTQTKIGEVLKK